MGKMVKITCAGAVLTLAIGLFADDPVYITGAEYEVSNEWLIVKSGDGTLVEPFDKKDSNNASRLLIAQGASLTLGLDQPFAYRPVLYIDGMLDLNGHSMKALRLFNADGSITYDTSDRRSVPGRIINSSTTAVTLTFESSNSSYFYGSIEECPGTIDLTSVASGDFVVKSPVCTNAVSSITVTGSKGVLRPETMPTAVVFVFRPPVDETVKMKVAEIELTYQGKTVQASKKLVATSSKDASDPNGANIYLIDGKANTYWAAGETGVQTVTITVTPPVPIDGYRITPRAVENRPTGWDVYVARDNKEGWKSYLVDSRRDFNWYSRRNNSSTTNLFFSADVRLGSVLDTNTAVTLNSSAATPMEVSTITPLEIKSLSGSGQVLLRHGTVFCPGDMSGFAGQFTYSGTESWTKMAFLALNATHGSEQQFAVASPCNLAVVNGGEELVSVLLDDSRVGQNLFGKLADGEKGQLGLVKRGSGERVIETEDASYTGPTVVHAGTLTVARKRTPVTARYLRFSPQRTFGKDTNGYYWGANEFEVLDENGEKVVWPAGTVATKPSGTKNELSSTKLTQLIDGNSTTRFLMPNYSSDPATFGPGSLPPVTIDTKTGVTFSSYRWWTVHQYKSRLVLEWKLEVSDDNANWVTCDAGVSDGSDWVDGTASERGPLALNELTGSAQSTGTGLYTLPSDFVADGTARDTHRKLKSQYFMLRVFETANPENTVNSFGWELGEISLYKDGERVAWPAGTTIAYAGSQPFSSNNSQLTNLVNNVVWEPNGNGANNPNAERTFFGELPSFVVINAQEELEFDSYAFVSTSMSVPYTDRIPKAWTFCVATNNNNNDDYVIIDSVGAYMPGVDYVITQNYQQLGPFDVASKYPVLDTTAANSIGDRSPVAISNNAALKIAADYEKFGPLSGAGTLELVWNAVGEINACAPATFAGSVTGKGTLAVCGSEVQTFDGATLSGVETLELNDGAIAGTASFGGNDVTVAFNGGATGATLSGIGTLTVTGDVKYTLPDLTGQDSYAVMLFTATNIPAASRTLLATGEVVGAFSRKWNWRVAVTDTTVMLSGNKRGTLIMVQ